MLTAVQVTYPDIKLSRPDGFWKTGGIDDCSRKIEYCHWYQCSKCCKVPCLMITISYYVVNYRNTTAQSECHESSYMKHNTVLQINVSYDHTIILASSHVQHKPTKCIRTLFIIYKEDESMWLKAKQLIIFLAFLQ